MSKKKQTPILSDKIAELIAPRRLLDPEIDSEDETAARAIDYGIDEDFDGNEPVSLLSDIRRKNVKLLHDVDAKYQGKVSSRKELEMETSESEENGDFNEDDEDDDDAASSDPNEAEKSIGEFSMMLTPRQKIKLAQNVVENNDENSVESDELSEDEGDIKSFAMKLNQSKQKSEATDEEASDSDGEADAMDEHQMDKWDDDYEGEEEQSAEEEEEEMNGTDDEGDSNDGESD